MNLYRVKPNVKNWGVQYKYGINATHEWGLPGVHCSTCGNSWSTTGVIYPVVDLSILPMADRFRDVRPVSVEEFRILKNFVSPLLPDHSSLPPGTELGKLVGNAWGKFGDFAWVNPWTMLIQSDTHEKFFQSGIELPVSAKPDLKYRSRTHPDLIELQIEPVIELVKASFSPRDSIPCPSCGYNSHKLQQLIIDKSSIPQKTNLFRPRGHPTHIIATEEFIEMVKAEEMKDISFIEVLVE